MTGPCRAPGISRAAACGGSWRDLAGHVDRRAPVEARRELATATASTALLSPVAGHVDAHGKGAPVAGRVKAHGEHEHEAHVEAHRQGVHASRSTATTSTVIPSTPTASTAIPSRVMSTLTASPEARSTASTRRTASSASTAIPLRAMSTPTASVLPSPAASVEALDIDGEHGEELVTATASTAILSTHGEHEE